MMIFNSFTVANDYIFGAQWPNDRRVFLETNKTIEGICLAPSWKFVIKTILLKKIKFSLKLIYEQFR